MKVDPFYSPAGRDHATHLSLCWKGRVRFTVPRDAAGQKACWRFFQPGWLGVALRAKAHVPLWMGTASCMESNALASIRESIGREVGISCARTGAPGPWSKDTILLMDGKTSKPLYVAKAGTGAAVSSLLENEARWLQLLQDEAPLADHIPAIVAHRAGADLSFVVQSPLAGRREDRFGEPHIAFLRKLQQCTRQTMRFEESRLYRSLRSRLHDLRGLLTEAWSARLEGAMLRIERSLSVSPVIMVASHNDFAPWNIRVMSGVARVFDWEYADFEQLPLFDPLHFLLQPMALQRQPEAKMMRSMNKWIDRASQWLGKESCHEAQAQSLAYMMNLCTLYLCAERGRSDANPILESHAQMIDCICRK